MNMYESFVKEGLFLLPAEMAHDLTHKSVNMLSKSELFLSKTSKKYQILDPSLHCKVAAMQYRNPIGNAAGFDKNCNMIDYCNAWGLGSYTIGTVTPLPQIGNPKPRMFRLEKDQAIINRMGFNNDGHIVVRERLINAYKRNPGLRHNPNRMMIGVSLGTNKTTIETGEISKIVYDYISGYKYFYRYVDYFRVGISSPNTKGLRALQTPKFLELLAKQIAKLEDFGFPLKPIQIKLSPDLTDEAFIEMVEYINNSPYFNGIVNSNTTITRDGLPGYSHQEIGSFGNGGLSGKMLYPRNLARLKLARKHTDKTIISVGGIDSPEKVAEVIAAGASACEIYTGFVYKGPELLPKSLKLLVKNEINKSEKFN